MKRVVITGVNGFIGKNLGARLQQYDTISLDTITRGDTLEAIQKKLALADVVYHLAGVNRPEHEQEFQTGNVGLTEFLVNQLESTKRLFHLVYTSSSQVELDNPYGASKSRAEEVIRNKLQNGFATIYRLPGVFGKWSRPNYNSVVATFCHNLTHDLPIHVRDNNAKVKLVYIDDVVSDFLSLMDHLITPGSIEMRSITPVYEVTLGKIVELLNRFAENRNTLFLPRVGDAFEKALYSTWLSFLPTEKFSYPMSKKMDDRGWLFEFLKTETSGQMFISNTLPGITRGNHFHHSKVEKFLVIKGKGLIRFRNIFKEDVIEYMVAGENPKVIDIPPGYTHNITNVGDDEMITLFWANEIFDPNRTDTYFLKV